MSASGTLRAMCRATLDCVAVRYSTMDVVREGVAVWCYSSVGLLCDDVTAARLSLSGIHCQRIKESQTLKTRGNCPSQACE